MPEVSRFYGIIIRMYSEVGGQHDSPHFHAYYQSDAAVFSIDPVEMIAGELERKQRRLVEASAELHPVALLDNWNRLQVGEPALYIDLLE